MTAFLDRRTLLKGIAGVAAGLILPPTLADNAEAVESWTRDYRVWALDRTMAHVCSSHVVTAVEYDTIYVRCGHYFNVGDVLQLRDHLWLDTGDGSTHVTVMSIEEHGPITTARFT